MHHGSVVLAREDITSAAHVGGQLIHLVDAFHNMLDNAGIPEISHDEFVRGRRGVLVPFEIDGAHPIALAFQPPHKMTADKSPGAVYENLLHDLLLHNALVIITVPDGQRFPGKVLPERL
jgi:hypothetical protein